MSSLLGSSPAPILVACFGFDPATPATLLPGSWGVVSVTATIAGQAFTVLLSSSGALTALDAESLLIFPTVHEAWTGQTITPLVQGFNIDFGAPLVRRVTFEIKRLSAAT